MTTLAAPAPTQPPSPAPRRRRPIGAEILDPQTAHFRVWAPRSRQVELVLEHPCRTLPLEPEGNGYHSARIEAGGGTLYRFRLDRAGQLLPDPASRFQPRGPFGPSEVVDLDAFSWSDRDWRGCSPRGRAVYEMHVGTFTP